MRTQSQLIKQCQRRLCLQFGGGFPLNGSQQHRQQAAHNAPFAIAKEVHFTVFSHGISQPDAVFASGNLFSLRF
ncbi:Uncharacterised protein [Shigella sonnei]|nr:Uncharacterised protein [Shigella sonnei]